MAVLENIITHSMSIVPPHRSFGASSPVGGSIVGDAPYNVWMAKSTVMHLSLAIEESAIISSYTLDENQRE